MLLPFLGGDFEDGEEGFLGDVDLADALHALSTVNLATVADIHDSDGLGGVINLVDNAVIPEANAPA